MSNVMTDIKSGLLVVLFGLSAASFSTSPIAEDIKVPVGKQSQEKVKRPTLGQSMKQVEAKFGAPLEKTAAVGEPPITRWRYAKFTVYFEHDKVIHSVIHRS